MADLLHQICDNCGELQRRSRGLWIVVTDRHGYPSYYCPASRCQEAGRRAERSAAAAPPLPPPVEVATGQLSLGVGGGR